MMHVSLGGVGAYYRCRVEPVIHFSYGYFTPLLGTALVIYGFQISTIVKCHWIDPCDGRGQGNGGCAVCRWVGYEAAHIRGEQDSADVNK